MYVLYIRDVMFGVMSYVMENFVMRLVSQQYTMHAYNQIIMVNIKLILKYM